MAKQSVCPGCREARGFEAVPARIDGTRVHMVLIRCKGCGVVVGTHDPGACDFDGTLTDDGVRAITRGLR